MQKIKSFIKKLFYMCFLASCLLSVFDKSLSTGGQIFFLALFFAGIYYPFWIQKLEHETELNKIRAETSILRAENSITKLISQRYKDLQKIKNNEQREILLALIKDLEIKKSEIRKV